MNLSKDFTLGEMCRSETAIRHGLENNPDKAQVEALRLLCANVLQPIRNHFGPIRVTSGFRTVPVNSWVGGSVKSDHCRGKAADIESDTTSPREIADWVREHLTYKQLILEFPPDGWVHVSYDAADNRREVLTAVKQGGKTVYLPGIVT